MRALPTDGIFDTIAGLPVHPLVVHAAVVLLPLGAFGVLVLLVVARWRLRFGWLTLAALAAGVGASVVAEQSGEALARRVGMPREHAEWGERLPPVAVMLFVVALVWFLLVRRAASRARRAAVPGGGGPSSGGGTATTVAGFLAGLLAVATLGVTVLVGHSGATAVWSGRIAATSSTAATSSVAATPATGSSGGATSAAGTTTKSGSTTAAPAAGSYTMDMVRAHNSASSCWSAISGSVYDLTSWISQHPGGPVVITAICGTDGTAAFAGQHAGERRPANELAGFKLGPLA